MSNTAIHKFVTQDDVARRAGVTRSIVSYVINNSPRKVSGETRSRVLAAIEELGYRPNKHARILSSAEENPAGNYIGIILAGNYMFKRPYYGSILASMHERVHELGWHIQFVRVYDDFCDPVLFDQLIHRNEIRGVVLTGLDQVPEHSSCDTVLVEEIIRRVERVVCVDWEWPGVPSVQFDRRNGAYQITTHLLNLGRKRIAYIGPADKRVTGYQQALREKGITLEKGFIYTANSPVLGYEQCHLLIESGVQFDAIFSGTDEAGIGILHCLNHYGLRVPEDISVASIDNIEISAFTIPALTTMGVPMNDIGRHAIDILVSDQTWQTSPGFTVTVPTQLVVRGSSIPQLVTPTNSLVSGNRE